jgi:hypothetical protein
MRDAIIAYRSSGAELGGPYFLTLLAQAYGCVNQGEEGLRVLHEVLTIPSRSVEYEAESYRLKGQLMLQQNRGQGIGSGEQQKDTNPRPLSPDFQGAAEACFLQALASARRQQSRSLELRAAMSLSQLWRQQGKVHEAGRLLADIYSWFTEGFASPDLRRARTLLEELTVG